MTTTREDLSPEREAHDAGTCEADCYYCQVGLPKGTEVEGEAPNVQE